MTVLALIAARGGSKGIPRKNLAEVGGRSLVARAVASASSSGVCDRIVCSTDDDEIAQAATAAGAEVPFRRPAALSGDATPMLPVVRHAISELERSGTAVTTLVLLQATVPFRRGAEIAAAVALFAKGQHRSVITVCPLERKPHNIFVKRQGETLERVLRDPSLVFVNRQDMAALCRLGNGVYVVGRDDVMKGDDLVPEPIGYIESDRISSLDIDDDIDLALARLLADKRGL